METKETYIGVDYGIGKSNRDENFYYGVIHQNNVLQAWADSSEPCYGEIETDENGDEVELGDLAEPLSFTLDDGEYLAESDDQGDIFITKSPYFTYCLYYFPCAPVAGNIMHSNPAGIRTYCFGHDWFDNGIAPYPVFDCADGLPILPE